MCQSGVDELNHPLRECGMHTYFQFQSQQETVVFEDTVEKQFYSFPTSTSDHLNDSAPQELGDFLKRPVLIKKIEWDPAGVADDDFDPWSLYFNNSSIKVKLAHFQLFRGNMHIKVVINAAPFYYGAMMINYTPTPDYVAQIDNTWVTALINQSQKPHLWIDLRTNMGGEMILPFIYPYNYVDITSAAGVATLGRLRNITFDSLKSANGATVAGVTISVYAWIEDPVLTNNTKSLAMQSKKQVDDEYGNGLISKPASALAHWASYLVNVPVIGTYAKATQIGASAISSVAGLFGWSKVPIIEHVKPVKPMFFHDLASAEISQPMVKYTLDPKAELSVDPRIPGPSTGEDEMSISYLVQKQSYVRETIWNTTDAPDTLLCSAVGSPSVCRNDPSAANDIYRMGYTPMGYVSEAFTHWRGDIIVTLKVICSQFHRGRLRVYWEPSGIVTTDDTTELNITKIVDIGESTELEFRIPYINRKAWLKTRTNFPPVTTATGIASATFWPDYDNGRLSVRVLNTLSAPIDVAPVTVLMFMRGAENLEFANPRELSVDKQFFKIQSLVEDVSTTDHVKSSPLQDRYLIHFGEPIPSLRLLMQRSNLHQTIPMVNLSGETAAATQVGIVLKQGRFPSSPGYDPSSNLIAYGIRAPTSYFRYVWCNMTHMAWFSPMYVARRGSIQWHFAFHDSNNIVKTVSIARSVTDTISANSSDLTGTAVILIPNTLPSRNTAYKTLNDFYKASASGVALTENTVNPSISVEMPMLTGALYNITKPDLNLLGYTEDESDHDIYTLRIAAQISDLKNSARLQIQRYCNIGTDFSLSMFLCVPQVYYCAISGDVPLA